MLYVSKVMPRGSIRPPRLPSVDISDSGPSGAAARRSPWRSLTARLALAVRAVQPVLQSLDLEAEEAAATLGAGSATIFRRVTLPALWLPIASGALLSFARAIGEFGAIVIVAGNIPLRTQTAAVFVFGEVESANREGASAMSIVMLSLAFALVLFVDWLRKPGRKENQE